MAEVKVKNFDFISFEKWKEQKFKWENKLGDFYCKISLFELNCSGDGNTYVAAISTGSNPTNIYSDCVYRVKSQLIDSVYNEDKLKDWYNSVVTEIKVIWEQYIILTYLE